MYFCRKFRTMNTEVKQSRSIEEFLEEVRERNIGYNGEKKTLEQFYGCLIRGYDGLEYQKAVRYGAEVD